MNHHVLEAMQAVKAGGHVSPFYMNTCMLQGTPSPEIMRLTGEDVNQQFHDTLVEKLEEYELHTVFVSPAGLKFEVPNDVINYEFSEKELAEMVEERVQLPHNLKYDYEGEHYVSKGSGTYIEC